MSEDDATATTAEDLQFILQETRLTLLQQILAHETGALSAEELIYRNPDLTEENIRYHLRELDDRGVVEPLEIPPGERQRDLPNTFFAVSDAGVHLLKRVNLYDEIDVWAEVYENLERTERVEAIEHMDHRPRADRSERRGSPGVEEGMATPPVEDRRS